MNDDTIRRREAIDVIKILYEAAEKWGREATDEVIKVRAESCLAGLIEMKLRIEKLPSTQPERKKGRWINYKDEHCCSICDRVITEDCWDGENRYDYCPYCGSDMRGEE